MSPPRGKRADELDLVDTENDPSPIFWGFVTTTSVSVAFTAVGLGLAYWLTWLHWPVVIVLGLVALSCLGSIFTMIHDHVARKDTATSTVRAAAQGLAEIRATVEPIPGRELVSPLFDATCAFHLSIVRGHPRGLALGSRVLIHKVGQTSFLLDDGSARMFVPGDANLFAEITLVTKRTVAIFPEQWRPLLDDPTIDLGRYKSFTVEEQLVPAGLTLQVNGEFRTLTSDDSYFSIRAIQTSQPVPSADFLRDNEVENDWRALCRHEESLRSDGAPARVNAILPRASAVAQLSLTDARDGRLLSTVVLVVLTFVFGLFPALGTGWLLGLIAL